MSVKRFDLDDVEDTGWPSMNEWDDGHWVSYEDYQKLEADVNAIRNLCESTIKTYTSQYNEWEKSRSSFARQIIEILDGKKGLP